LVVEPPVDGNQQSEEPTKSPHQLVVEPPVDGEQEPHSPPEAAVTPVAGRTPVAAIMQASPLVLFNSLTSYFFLNRTNADPESTISHNIQNAGPSNQFSDETLVHDESGDFETNDYEINEDEEISTPRTHFSVATNHFEARLGASIVNTMLNVLEIPAVEEGKPVSDLLNAIFDAAQPEGIDVALLPSSGNDVHFFVGSIGADIWPSVPVFNIPLKVHSSKGKDRVVGLLPNIEHAMINGHISSDHISSNDCVTHFVITANRNVAAGIVDQSNIWHAYAIQCPESLNFNTQFAVLVAFVIIDEVSEKCVSYILDVNYWFLSVDGDEYKRAYTTGYALGAQASVFLYKCCGDEEFQDRRRSSFLDSHIFMGLQTGICMLALANKDTTDVDMASLIRIAVKSKFPKMDDSDYLDRIIFRYLFGNTEVILSGNYDNCREALENIGIEGLISMSRRWNTGYVIRPDTHLMQGICSTAGEYLVLDCLEHIFSKFCLTDIVTEEGKSVIIRCLEERLDALSRSKVKTGTDSLLTPLLTPSLNDYENWSCCVICGLKLLNPTKSTKVKTCTSCKGMKICVKE